MILEVLNHPERCSVDDFSSENVSINVRAKF